MDELTADDWHRLKAEARDVFEQNEVDTGTAYFHMPSAEFYPSLFAWDSGFQSVVMVHLDLEKAKRELETLFDQVAADGHMPHEVLVPCEKTRKRITRNVMRWFARWEYDSRGASRLVDPPVFVYAARLVYERSGDAEWLSRVWPNLSRCVDYLMDRRDLFGDGLVSIVHPWEAGTDLSPQFFEVMGIDPTRSLDRVRAAAYGPLLYRSNNRMGWDPVALKAANRFVVEDLTVNCITIKAVQSAAVLASAAGDESAAGRYRSRASLMADALDRICFDESSGCYYPRWNSSAPRLATVRTAASLLPLFTGLCDEENCGRLVREHLLDPQGFWTRYPLPFNPAGTLEGNRNWVEGRLWAGHCTWINFNWMVAIGLGEGGYAAEARELTRRTVKMVLREGFCEYYDSRDGEGRRIRGFTWPGLALDMMARFLPQMTGDAP